MVDQAQAPTPSPGIQAYKTKDFIQAIVLLNGEVQADPTDTKLKLYLGLSYFGANNHMEAKNVLIPLRTECSDGALKEKLDSVLAQIEKALASPPNEPASTTAAGLELSEASTSIDVSPPAEGAPPTAAQEANFAEALAFLNEGDAGAGFGTVVPAGLKAEVLPAFAERQAAKEAAGREEGIAAEAQSEQIVENVAFTQAPASTDTGNAVESERVPPEEQLSDDDPIVNSGLNMYNQGDYEGCAKVLKRRITQIPQHWKARLYLGRCQHLLHDYLAAERTLSFLLTNSDSEEARAAADAEISKFRSAMRAAEPKVEAHRPAEVIKERTPVDSFPAVKEPEPPKPKVEIRIPREQIAVMLALVLCGVLVYLGVGMYVSNSDLYQAIFLQPAKGQDLPAQDMEIMGVKGEPLELTGAAGSKLSAVIYRKPDARRIAIINHDFDGNLNSRMDYVRLFLKADMSVLLYDYGGFGKSTGEATLARIGGEGFLVADYLQGREGVEPENMVFFGEYLGCAVAEQMGKYRQNAAVILHGPFPSYTELAREKYPFLKLYSDDTIPAPHGDAEPFLKTHNTPVLLVVAPNKGLIKREYVEKLLPKTIDIKNKYEVPDYSGPMPDKVQDEYANVIKQFVHDYSP